MSIADFVADPYRYTKSHVVQFQHSAFQPAQAGMQVLSTLNNWAGVWTAEHHGLIGGEFTSFSFQESTQSGRDKDGERFTKYNQRIGKGADRMHTVNVNHGTVDLGIRYLPWKANAVTYMTLDNAAKTFFTGPLSGCSIYIGKVGTTYWAFHANRNATGAPNPAVKATMVDNVNVALPAQVQILHSAIYQREYSEFGFVFGQKRSGVWTFYAADTTSPAANRFITTVRRLP
jgi:hypothetical protein